LLEDTAFQIAQGELAGREIDGRPGVFGYLVRWKNARHGHYVIYIETESGVHVIRFLHSSMDILDQI